MIRLSSKFDLCREGVSDITNAMRILAVLVKNGKESPITPEDLINFATRIDEAFEREEKKSQNEEFNKRLELGNGIHFFK